MAALLDESGGVLLDESGGTLYDEAGAVGGVVTPSGPSIVHWTWVLGGTPPAGVELRELTQAYGRTLTMRVDGAWTAQFAIDGRSSEAATVVSLATDLTIYRDGVKMFRGRITTESDDIDATRHVTQFSATDYRGMLAYRVIGVLGKVFTGIDQAVIAYTLITDSQALDGGDWGISDGAGAASGTLRDRTYDPGKPLLDVLTELGRVDNGFEWEIDPDLALNRWYPTRGTNNGVVLDYGGKITGFSRLLQPRDFGNAVLLTGSQGIAAVAAETVDVATDPRGRWEMFVGYPSVQEQSTLNAKTLWELDQASTLRPELQVTFAPGRWGGLTDVGLGDTVALGLRSGRLNETGDHRVVEIICVPGEDGTETIQAGLVAA